MWVSTDREVGIPVYCVGFAVFGMGALGPYTGLWAKYCPPVDQASGRTC